MDGWTDGRTDGRTVILYFFHIGEYNLHINVIMNTTKQTYILVLQQTHHIVTHTGPHKVTSSNIYQIKAKSLPNPIMHDASSVCRGVNFYESLKKGTHTNK